MKKSVKWVLSAVIGISVFLFAANISYAETAPDNKVNIVIEFEKAEYFPGETAKAYIRITGVGDEAEAGYKLGALETGIKFDNSKLQFKAAEYKILSENSSECSIALDGDETESDLIVALFYSGTGEEFTVQPDGGFVLAELVFNVREDVSGEAAVGFDDIYESMFVLPKSQEYIELACAMADDVKINITAYEYIIESGGAAASDTAITDSVTVRIKEGTAANAQLIGGLYEKDGELLLLPVVIKNVGVDEQPYSISFDKPAAADGKQLEIRYYLWNSTAIVSPLASKKSAAVN